ncbi:Na+/H+ antiporter subunit E [Microbacterium album]|uniref:Na+/H+ antiporter subunit E n=1 Tax=Microbacterium album TaxID=2053191 RepID=UPI001E3AAEAB|nr:Na+/H+ antiporter subunit E [Microbacterium album]
MRTPSASPSPPTGPGRALRIVRAVVLRGAVLALVWVVLAGWDAAYAGYGAVSVGAATALSLAMFPVTAPPPGTVPPWRRARAIAELPLWFLGKSIVGGADVAWRALKRPVDIQPAVVRAPCVLSEGNTRQLALLMMNLMPGTMVQRVVDDGATVELHTLAEALHPARQWEELQHRVAAAFGQPTR